MRTTTWLAVAVIACAAIGCGGTDDGDDTVGDDTAGDDSGGDDVPPGVLDVRVPIPEPDPEYVDLITPEETIAPGDERMYCYYLDNHEGDLALRGMATMQGQYGHHVTLLSTDERMPDGTRVDCSGNEYMAKMRAYVYPIDPLPDGVGVMIPADSQYVLQMHYVNAGDQPILVRDVARLHRVDAAAVTTWAAALTTNDLTVNLPPGESTSSWDCVIENDVDLLLLGGHMHENGTVFSVEIGPDAESLENLYLVDPWKSQYRDAPPISLFFTEPRHLTPGTVVRTNCTWMNPGTTAITFPEEMCSAFAYIGRQQEPLRCQLD